MKTKLNRKDKIKAYLVKVGHNSKEVETMVNDNFEIAIRAFPNATPRKLADFILRTR